MTQTKTFAHTNTGTQREAISIRMVLSAANQDTNLSVCVLDASDKTRQNSSDTDFLLQPCLMAQQCSKLISDFDV